VASRFPTADQHIDEKQFLHPAPGHHYLDNQSDRLGGDHIRAWSGDPPVRHTYEEALRAAGEALAAACV
jgi:hypothetical protein